MTIAPERCSRMIFERMLAGEGGAAQVDAVDVIEGFLGDIHQVGVAAAQADAHVVVQDVERAPATVRLADGRQDVGFLRDVGLTAMASPPSARIIAAVSSTDSIERSAATTRAPSRAKRMAAARPLPNPSPGLCPAPKTTATFPSSLNRGVQPGPCLSDVLTTSPIDLKR